MKRYVIAIDLGATSGRVILSSIGEDNRVEMETLHHFPTRLLEIDGKYHWDLFDIRDNLLEGLRIAAGRGVKIESIGVDTWGVDFVGVNADGTINGLPRSYRDPYSFAAMDEFLGIMPREELYGITGIQIMNFNSVFQMYAQNKDGSLSRTDRILFIPDAISYMLTGKMVCEYTILSTSALIDPVSKEFSQPILKVCGLGRDKFPDIVLPGTRIGVLKEEYGFGAIPVVAVAGFESDGELTSGIQATGNYPGKARNRTFSDYRQCSLRGGNLLFCALAGLLWYSRFFGLSLGKGFLTDYPVLITFSWCILMALNVTFSNVWGIILKEWKGLNAKTIAVLVTGLAILVFSTFLPQLL